MKKENAELHPKKIQLTSHNRFFGHYSNSEQTLQQQLTSQENFNCNFLYSGSNVSDRVGILGSGNAEKVLYYTVKLNYF